ncbi:MAG TPA: phospholipase D-like domain-containing protein, partial [Bryobacteraceae bacterium]
MKLLVQPEDGIKPILTALKKAEKSIQILIFRFDRTEIEKALVSAVRRGVTVQALIAYTNQGEEKNLRRLES